MQVGVLIEINTIMQADIIRHPQTNPVFDRRPTIHIQDQAIEDSP
jgi:hypothetical protein